MAWPCQTCRTQDLTMEVKNPGPDAQRWHRQDSEHLHRLRQVDHVARILLTLLQFCIVRIYRPHQRLSVPLLLLHGMRLIVDHLHLAGLSKEAQFPPPERLLGLQEPRLGTNGSVLGHRCTENQLYQRKGMPTAKRRPISHDHKSPR